MVRSRAHADIVLAVALAIAIQLDLWLLEGGPSDQPVVTVVSALLFTGALAWRTDRPQVMVALACLALVGGSALGGQLTETISTAVTAMVIVFSIGALPRLRASLISLAVFAVAVWLDLALVPDPDTPLASDIAFTSAIVLGAPWLAGRALRDRRNRTDELEQLAEQLRAERELRADLAVRDERARIAREMHDVVAHSVSLMVVQAGAARHLLDEDIEQSRTALRAAEDAGREALHELRRTLGVLRSVEGADVAELRPQPGLDQLAALVEHTRAAGLPVDVSTQGAPRSLPPGADLAAYRIVQEALTNTRKHAGPGAHAAVELTWSPFVLELAVTDDGRGADGPAAARGHGLVGMRERVAAYGGSIVTGTLEAGGFAVRARFPLDNEEKPAG